MINNFRVRYIFFLSLLIFVSAGCSTSASYIYKDIKENTGTGTVLDVPFVEQKDKYCGPAALSSVFAYWDRSYTQEEIAEDIFQSELCGVLNVDLEQYARGKGFWAKGLKGDFKRLKERLNSGVPVVVLEKLHPFVLNRMHYVVVVGYSDKHRVIIQHTGSKEFVIRSYDGFKRNWYAGGSWMLEVMPFDKIGDELNNPDSIELGILLEEHGKLEEALERYLQVLEREPENAVVLFNIGNIYQKLNRFDEAEKAYKEAIAKENEFSDALNNLSWVYLQKQDYAAAHDYVDKALSCKSNKQFYYLDTKAQIYLAQGEIEKAIEAYNRAKTYQQHVSNKALMDFYKFWNNEFDRLGIKETQPD